jgi:hypothetical protein
MTAVKGERQTLPSIDGTEYPKRMSTRGGASGATAEKISGASEQLAKLRRGELTLDAYLDFRADEAVKDLASTLPTRRVQVIREAIREQLATDPVLLAMVEHVAQVGREGTRER